MGCAQPRTEHEPRARSGTEVALVVAHAHARACGRPRALLVQHEADDLALHLVRQRLQRLLLRRRGERVSDGVVRGGGGGGLRVRRRVLTAAAAVHGLAALLRAALDEHVVERGAAGGAWAARRDGHARGAHAEVRVGGLTP